MWIETIISRITQQSQQHRQTLESALRHILRQPVTLRLKDVGIALVTFTVEVDGKVVDPEFISFDDPETSDLATKMFGRLQPEQASAVPRPVLFAGLSVDEHHRTRWRRGHQSHPVAARRRLNRYAFGMADLEGIVLGEIVPGGGRVAHWHRTTASTDEQVVAAWIKAHARSPSTIRAFQFEADRLLAWIDSPEGLGNGYGFAYLNGEDLDRYRRFLRDPQPAELWIGQRPNGRVFFRRPLGDAAVSRAMGALKSLFTYCHKQGYLRVTLGA